MATPVRLRTITHDEGNRLLRMVRRTAESIVTWRRTQMILLADQGMDPTHIAEVTFTSPDRVRDVIHAFNTDGFDSLHPHYAGGRPRKFTDTQRTDITKIALAHPDDLGLPFSTWSLSKLVDHLISKGVVDDISHEGLRRILRENNVCFPGHQKLENLD